MDLKVLQVLEFHKIIQKLAEFALSDLGKRKALNLVPLCAMDQITQCQQETDEAQALICRMGDNPMLSFEDVTRLLKRVAQGAVLSMGELLLVAQNLKIARLMKERLHKDDYQNCAIIHSLAGQLTPLFKQESEIHRCILGEDEMSDEASPKLGEIRRKIRRSNDRIKEKLHAYIKSPQYQKYLQDPIVTLRQDRYVLPVKQEYRGQIPGLVHDQSASGATLFIEPMAVVEMNNELRHLFAQEREEIEAILRRLTQEVEAVAHIISANTEILAQLDFIFAKGMLSRHMRGISPKLNQNGHIHIIKGRHPLIDPQKVVPLTLWLGKTFHTLIVTGPNTGGKTVLLKTTGLLTLMAQAGLHVPAEYGTELAVFEQVFADIGDEQSIEQSLSTFSSHMRNIVEVFRKVNASSLVLFDELGAGTDPAEGAALAMAILQSLAKKKARIVATTHYSELKAFALTHDGYENASMEFDLQTLSPTYRVFIGIPGKSNAFEISDKLGLPKDVIEKARRYMAKENIAFETVISLAEEKRLQAEADREKAFNMLQEAQLERQKLENAHTILSQKQKELLDKAKAEAKEILIKAQEEADRLLKQIRQWEKGIADKGAVIAQKARLRKKAAEYEQPALYRTHGVPLENLRAGERVKVLSFNKEGIVCSLPDDKNNVQVQVGAMKITVKTDELERFQPPPSERAVSVAAQTGAAQRTLRTEIDLRGQTVEEAVMAIDLFLDQAVLSGIHTVYLIHGKGTGALRAGVRQHLKKHPHIAEFRSGVYGEGETGVTVVTLK